MLTSKMWKQLAPFVLFKGGNANSDFAIVPATGVITTAKSIAFTSTPLVLLITATDTGSAVSTGTVSVVMKSGKIHFNNINDIDVLGKYQTCLFKYVESHQRFTSVSYLQEFGCFQHM